MRPFIKNSQQNIVLKYFRIFISLSIVLSVFNPMIIASAASAETVSISSVPGKINPGESAQVEISIANSVNVTGMNLTLVYDTSVVSLNSVSENTSVVSGHAVSNGGIAGAITIELRQLDNLTNAGSVPVIDLVFDGVAGGSSDLILQSVVLLEDGAVSYPSATGSVTVDYAPVLASIGSKSVREADPLSFTVVATDSDGDDVSYSINNKPASASFDDSTGLFSWTPGRGENGTYDVEFIAFANVLEDNEVVRITVTSDNPPVLASIGSKSVRETDPLSFTVVATDSDGDDVSYSINNKPASASFDDSTGLFSWIPSYEDSGIYDVTFIANANDVPDSETITITVTNVDRPVVLDPINNKIAYEGSPLNFTITADDPDEGDTVTYDSVGLPGGAILDQTSGDFSWTPNYDVDEGDHVDHVVKFIARANGKYDNETITITVNDVNRAPKLDPISTYSVKENETVEIILHATDDDGDLPLYYNTTSSVGSLTGNVFTWTPTYNDSGSHDISFTVSDRNDGTGLTDTEVAVITVNDENAAPVFNEVGSQNVTEGSTLSFKVSANDVDSDDELTYSVEEQPEGSSVAFSSGIIFTWTPAYDDAGNHSAIFKVTDGSHPVYLQVYIEVYDYNHAPVFTSLQPSYTVNESERLDIILGAEDEDDDNSLTTRINDTGNASGTLVGDVYVWDTDYLDSGTYEIEFEVSDGKVTTVRTTTVTVNDVNAPPVLSSIGSRSVTEGSTLTFTLTATDVDGDTLTYSAQNLPANETLNATTGKFIWKPESGDAGTYNVIFSVSDGIANDSETVTITVTAASSSSSGGGGGGGSSSSDSSSGGGGSVGTGEVFENIALADYVLASVIKDVETVFTFKEINDIVSVSFTSKYNAGQVKAVVEILKGTSAQVSSAAPGVVYKNMNIFVDTSLPPEVLGNSKVNFKVDKSWVNGKDINTSTIVLCRYYSGNWGQLATEMTGEDEGYFYFTSESPGFSQFAISSIVPQVVGGKYVSENIVTLFRAGNDPMSAEDSTQMELTPEADQKSSASAFGFVVLLVLAGLGIMYWAVRPEP
jgi:PGF-pre-PGF domain-containing protein